LKLFGWRLASIFRHLPRLNIAPQKPDAFASQVSQNAHMNSIVDPNAWKYVAFALGLVAVSGCQTVATSPSTTTSSSPAAVAAPSLGFFSKIKAPADQEPVLQFSARGVQIFRCEKRDAELNWVFRQPDAELFDAGGKLVARHGASFSFEHVDGSRLLSTVAAYDEAPKATDLRWLLFTTRSFGKGAFDGVTHVQRVNTQGGMPPARCGTNQLGQLLRVDFSSDFVFYRLRAGASG
jgi:hypothetical protein